MKQTACISNSKILVINLGGIGDMLLSLPALKALKNSCGEPEISVLVTERVYEVVKALPYINEIYKFNIGYGGVIPFSKIMINFKTLLALRKKRFNLAVNMRTLGSKKSALKIRLMLNIIKPGIKAGRNTEGRGAFFDIKIEETFIGQKYEMEYDMEMVKKIGAEAAGRNIELMIDKESENNVKNIFNEKGISREDIVIGIHPGGMPSRRWPIKNFSRVIKEINNKIHARFIITGGKGEADLGEELARVDSAKVINLVNKLKIKELEALIKRCNLFISNDTGPMHFAAVLKTPLIAIFGPGDIVRFDPRNISDKAVVFYKKTGCAPCENTTCDSLECLKEILPEEVINAANSLLTC